MQMSRTEGEFVFKSKAQILLKQLDNVDSIIWNTPPKVLSLIEELTEFIRTGGNFTSSYDKIVEIIQKILFRENENNNEEDNEIIIKTEEFLLVLLESSQLKSEETIKYFNFDFTVFLLKIFHKRCAYFGKEKTKQRWKKILHKFYSIFFQYRKYIYETTILFFDTIAIKSSTKSSLFSQINKNCQTEEEEIEMIKPYYIIAELLEIFGSIIAGFNVPINQNHISILLPILMRLHNNSVPIDDLTTTIQIYHRQLSYCISQFIEKSSNNQQKDQENSLLINIINNIIQSINNFSKLGNSKQTVFLLNEIEQLIENINENTFKKIKTNFFQLENNCFSSLNFTIAQRSILILNNPKILIMALNNRDIFFDAQIINSLIKTAKEHWNETSRQMSFQLLKKIDEKSTENKKLKNNNFEFKQLSIQWIEEEKEVKKNEKMKEKNQKKKKLLSLNILDFVYVKSLGVGSYSQVHQVRFIDHSVSQLYWEDYALKSMIKSHINNQKYIENINRERDLLNSFFGNPLITRLISSFEDDEKFYLLLEYTPNGDLFHLIEKFGTFNFEFAQFIVAEIWFVLHFLHSKKVVFGDLKPENILLFPNGHIKLTDFASSFIIHSDDSDMQIDNINNDDNKNNIDKNNNNNNKNNNNDENNEKKEEIMDKEETNHIAGTLEYLSPKLLSGKRKNLNYFDDVWALGCVVYQFFVGTLPFNGKDKKEVLEKINLPLIFPQEIPQKAKELIDLIFSHGEDENLTIEDLKKNSFFDGIQWGKILKSTPPIPIAGEVKVSESDLNLRQRKYSMMLTQSLPSAYSFAAFSLPPIPEDEPKSSSDVVIDEVNDN